MQGWHDNAIENEQRDAAQRARVSLVGSPAAAAAAAAAITRHGAAVQTVQLPPLFWLLSSRGRGLFA